MAQGPLRAAQFKGLRFLRHLRLLDLSFPSETGGTELDGFPDGLLSCTKLEALHMGFAGRHCISLVSLDYPPNHRFPIFLASI